MKSLSSVFAPLIIAVFFAMATVASAQSFYVATNGNDSWSGTIASPNAGNSDGPFRSFARAQSAMRSSSNKTTAIRGGTYSFTSTLNFDWSDTGQSWTQYGCEPVIIDGGGTGVFKFVN